MSPTPIAICLVIDRLSAAYLGALGNTWIRTPAFDALAAESIVFDREMIDSPVLDETYESYWTGTPAWVSGAVRGMPIAQRLRALELPTVLVTDASEIAEHPLAATFDEVVHLPIPDVKQQASDWQATQLAAFFAAAIDTLQSLQPRGLVWLHTGALGRIWDSPQEFRAQYADEDDPDPPPLVEPPSSHFVDGANSDFLLGLRHAYAGEVSVFDKCLGTLLETIAESEWREALFTLTAPRGYPLGEHEVVGNAGSSLYGELARVSWLMRMPNGPMYGARSDALVQPVDLFATLSEWFAPEHSTADDKAQRPLEGRSVLSQKRCVSRDLAIARAPSGETALVTSAWFARSPAPAEETADATLDRGDANSGSRRIELFVKPDDYFEVNEISDRCLDVAGEFRAIVDSLDRALRHGGSFEVSLSDALLSGIEASGS